MTHLWWIPLALLSLGSSGAVQSVPLSCDEIITVNVGVTGPPGSSESSGPEPVTGTNSSGSKSDLTVIELSLEDTSHNPIPNLHINTSARCRMRIKNQGSASTSKTFRTSCYISEGLKTDNNPKDEGGEDTQGLAAGATHTEHEDFSIEYPGWYNMMACVDSSHQVDESNENNQQLTLLVFFPRVGVSFVDLYTMYNPFCFYGFTRFIKKGSKGRSFE